MRSWEWGISLLRSVIFSFYYNHRVFFTTQEEREGRINRFRRYELYNSEEPKNHGGNQIDFSKPLPLLSAFLFSSHFCFSCSSISSFLLDQKSSISNRETTALSTANLQLQDSNKQPREIAHNLTTKRLRITDASKRSREFDTRAASKQP